ncbi:MAG TPA: GTP-binding protein [Beijerinckiaceae bacterium]|jgi:G3E family GTPase
MAMTDRRARIPISVLTGFLGSGKTTVLNRLVRHPDMVRALVVVNELGEIGLDHELVERATDDVVLLQSGCLCCSVRSDLIETLQAMRRKAERGEIPRFDRVIIETTGLADPGPILQAIMVEPAVTSHFQLDGVVATVDAVNAEATLGRHNEAVRQVAVADRILLTKTDLAEPAQAMAVEQDLAALNPSVPIIRTAPGEAIDPALLFGLGLYDPSSKSADVRRWLDWERGRPRASRPVADDASRHDARIRSASLAFDAPIAGEALDRWLNSLLRFRGPDLLRFKAIVNVTELPGPLVLHGVQHVIHPPVMLKEWPSADRRTRMVFITHDIDEDALRASLQELADAPA